MWDFLLLLHPTHKVILSFGHNFVDSWPVLSIMPGNGYVAVNEMATVWLAGEAGAIA